LRLEPDQAREFLELFLVGLDEFLELLGRSTRRRVAHEALGSNEFGVELRIGNELADLYNLLFKERTDADYADLKRVPAEFVFENLPNVERFIEAIVNELETMGYTL